MSEIRQALSQAISYLTQSSPSARIDAEILLAFVLNTTRTFLYTYPEKILNEAQEEQFQQLLTKRASGSPIAYLTQVREFWSLALQVNEHTLIPRPETELLVELTLKHLSHKPHAVVLDLGTGSGAIALALASERPNWTILASDQSAHALEIARFNAQNLKINNVEFYQSDWLNMISHQYFDAIISNPPYIEADDPHLSTTEIRFEPWSALVGGVDGLDALRDIVKQSYHRLKPDGFLLLEHGYNQKEAVSDLLNLQGFMNIASWKDVHDIYRVTGGWHNHNFVHNKNELVFPS